jgi:hypothetical protein
MILTEQEIERALNRDYQNTVNELVESADLLLKGNRMLVENRLSKQEYQVLQEGAWESIKYGLAKLGRYKAGGKIFGKGKIDQEAGAKIQSILDKKGNEVIKKLNDIIKQENPEFPNNKEGEKFLKTVIEIATVYDSIIEATKKNPKEEGYLPTDAANSIIADLAEYVKKFLDVDLASAYTVMDSEEEKVDGEDDKELLADEVEDINEDEAADVRAKLQAKKGGKEYDTKRMGKEGLKSNKLPMLLAGVGASLGAFSWLTNTEWFKHLFEETFKYTDTEQIRDVIETKTQVLNDIKPGEGVYKLLGRVTEHPLDGNSNPSELVDALKQIGGGDAHKGVDLLCQDGGVMMKPGEAAKGLHDLVNNPDQYDKLGDMFKNTASGTGKLAEPGTGLNTTSYGTVAGKSLTSLLVKKLPIIITKVVTKTGIKIGAGYAIAKGFGAVLGPIGIGLVAAGALVKLMRIKGQKQSRAKTLNDLLQSLQPIEAGESTLPPVLPDPKPNPVGGGEGGGKANKETLFNDLAGFFKFTYNNRKMASPDIFGDKEESSNPCSKFTKGQKVKTKAGKTVVVIANSTEDNTIEKGQVKVKREDGGTYAVRCTQLSESMINKGKLINEMSNNNLISEGKFIKDPEVIKILKQKSGIDSNKLKFFEGFMTRVEIIRNKVKKMDNTGDNVLDKFVQKLKSNPIMGKDFTKTFSVDPGNPQNVEAMGSFINDLIEIVYKGNFRGMTFKDAGGMVNKMGTLGGGNINKVSMGESYLVERKGKKAKAKSDLKNNMIAFITDLMGMFQYMSKLKRQGKLGGDSSVKTKELKKPGSSKEESPEAQQESIQKPKNKFLKEEVKRILTLMNKIK